MTTPAEALENGHLGDALALQRAIVADTPNDPKARLLLFELLTLAGHLHQARDQLRAIESNEPNWPDYRRQLLQLLKAEHRRSHRQGKPIVIPMVPAHAKYRWKGQRGDDPGQCSRWFDRAEDCSPFVSGHVDGREFDGIRDMDDRFASVLELFVSGNYVWVPWESLRHLRLSKAEGWLDAAFRPGNVELDDGRSFSAMVPLLYPGSHASNGVFALGHDTDWNGNTMQGFGQRILMLGDEEIPLADCRHLELSRR